MSPHSSISVLGTLCLTQGRRICGVAFPLPTISWTLLTYSMEQSPWEDNWFCSYSRNSPHFRNLKVPHRTHKRLPPFPILSHLHPVPTTPSHFLKIHLNIILPSTSGSPQCSLSLRFPNQNPVHTSPLPHTRHISWTYVIIFS
jgi:hypothetical protein